MNNSKCFWIENARENRNKAFNKKCWSETKDFSVLTWNLNSCFRFQLKYHFKSECQLETEIIKFWNITIEKYVSLLKILFYTEARFLMKASLLCLLHICLWCCARTGHLLQAYGGPSGQIHQRYFTEAQELARLHPDLFRNIIVQNIKEQLADFGFKKRVCGVRWALDKQKPTSTHRWWVGSEDTPRCPAEIHLLFSTLDYRLLSNGLSCKTLERERQMGLQKLPLIICYLFNIVFEYKHKAKL